MNEPMPLSNHKLSMQGMGEGETLVMIHGWGMHSGIWSTLATRLAQSYRVVCIDLPGHGRSDMICPLQLQEVSAQILQQVSEPAHWLGWSLGANIVMNIAADCPQRVLSLSLLAGNPCFTRRQGWDSGIDVSVLEQFTQQLQQDYKKTLMQFLALQTLGSNESRETLKQLKEKLFAVADARPAALRQGLQILATVDARDGMRTCDKPCLVVLGERDQLVPSTVADFYATLPMQPQVAVIEGAGHAPFISHAEETLGLIECFLADIKLKQAE